MVRYLKSTIYFQVVNRFLYLKIRFDIVTFVKMIDKFHLVLLSDIYMFNGWSYIIIIIVVILFDYLMIRS
jgi:hypothetical protein